MLADDGQFLHDGVVERVLHRHRQRAGVEAQRHRAMLPGQALGDGADRLRVHRKAADAHLGDAELLREDLVEFLLGDEALLDEDLAERFLAVLRLGLQRGGQLVFGNDLLANQDIADAHDLGIVFLAFDVLSLGCAFYKLRIFLV